MIDLTPLPNDRRNFVHQRIGRAVGGFVSSGFNPLAAVGGFLSTPRPTVPRTLTARPTMHSRQQQELGRQHKFLQPANFGSASIGQPFSPASAATCIVPGMRPDPVTGQCRFFLGDRPGRDTAPLQLGPGTGVGPAVMGRFGAALTPGSKIVDRAVCLRGMVLGNDGNCYNSKGFRNSDRMWPRGRRPLLTGGDMRAISIASRAATRLTNTAVRLQEIGLIKKPVTRRRAKKK